MKKFLTLLLTIVCSIGVASAQPYFSGNRRHVSRPGSTFRGDGFDRMQYDRIGSGIPYKGFLEFQWSGGISEKETTLYSFQTSHGLMIGENAFVGIGAGLTYHDTDVYDYVFHDEGEDYVSLPLYVDLRYFPNSTYRGNLFQPFLGVKVGAMFKFGDSPKMLYDGFVYSERGFYLSPSVGFRVPVGYKSGLNFALSYTLTTQRFSNDPYYYDGSVIGQSGLGFTIGFDW